MESEHTFYEHCQQRWLLWFEQCVDFHVPPGWYQLVTELLENLERLTLPPTFHVLQIKEKFGELRCYAVPTTPVIDELIQRTERRSRSLCDTCGSDRHVSNRGAVLRTLCEACRAAARRAAQEPHL